MGPKRSVTYDTTFQRTANTLQQDYPLRVVGYVRVSTDIQAQEGVSLDAQQERIQAYCVASGFRLVHLAQDDTSAKSLDRPGLAGALKLLECGKADALLVVKLDRLAEDHAAARQLEAALRQALPALYRSFRT